MVDLTPAELRQKKARARKALAIENRKQTLTLRGLGFTFVEIGEQLGISPQAANKTYWKAVEEAGRINTKLAEEAHETEMYRLNRCSRQAMIQMERGSLLALDRVIKTEERRRKILGNEPPEKTALTDSKGRDLPQHIKDMSDEELQARLKELDEDLGNDGPGSD